MATTTTKTKKKLVYKQDPDGVFRLKKVNGDEVPNIKPKHTSNTTKKKQVDDYLNELVDCSYKLFEDPPETPDVTRIEVSPATPISDPHDTKSTVKKRKSKQVEKNPIPEESLKETFPKVTTASATIHQEEPIVAASLESFLRQLKMAPQETMTQIKRFHPQSFILGVASALILYRLQPLLFHYGLIALNLAKYGVLWGIVLGGAGWYLGIVNMKDMEQNLARLKAKISGTSGNLTGRNTNATDDTPSIYDQEDLEYDDEEVLAPSPTKTSTGAYSKNATNPQLPPTERRNTLTSVTPFKHQQEQNYASSDFYSTPDLHLHQQQKQPKLTRIQTTENKPRYQTRPTPNVVQDRRRGAYTRHGLFDSTFSRQSPDKDLPTPPDRRFSAMSTDELPFINEVKLFNSYEMDNTENEMKRQNTTMSKKSVLGTLAKYSTFVANATYND